MNEHGLEDKQALVPVAQDSAGELQFFDEIFAAQDPQPLVAARLGALGPDQEGSPHQLRLQSMWNFLEGIRLITEEQNFVQAKMSEDQAAAGFEKLNASDALSICRAFSLFSSAVIEARNLNLNQALKLFAETEDYLRNAGRLGRKYEGLIDHMKPDSLFVGSMPALLTGDIDSARTLIKQASAMAERVADKYHERGSKMHYMLLGLAQFYRAFFSLFEAQTDLSNLELDKLVGEDIAASARAAEKFLVQADQKNKAVQNALHISRAMVEISEVIKQIAAHLHLCLKAAFKPDLQKFLDLKQRLRRAVDHASDVGPQGMSLVRICNALMVRIKNFERLAKPRTADFGIFSGIICSALFIPLLLAASWANNVYATGLDGKTLFLSVIALALIGGFGFGALRFKSLFMPNKTESE